ncbi:MAG: nuclear transport factor 2 family protein [Sphingomonas sp.]
MGASIRRALSAIALLAIPAGAMAAPTDRSADRAVITAGEHDWGHAFVVGDRATIDRLLADDFIGIDTHGKRYTKADMVAWVVAGPNLTADTVGPVDIAFYGDVAIARGSEHQIGPAPARAAQDRVWTDVWVRRDGIWRIVSAVDVDPALK